MSGYVTIPRALAVEARDSARMAKDRAASDGLVLERGRHARVALDLSAHLEASAPVDAGDPAANDTRPDPELLAALREAVGVQEATCVLEVVQPGKYKVLETFHDYPIPAGVAVVFNMQMRIPATKADDACRLARVVDIVLDGRAAIVKVVVWGSMPIRGPEPLGDNF